MIGNPFSKKKPVPRAKTPGRARGRSRKSQPCSACASLPHSFCAAPAVRRPIVLVAGAYGARPSILTFTPGRPAGRPAAPSRRGWAAAGRSATAAKPEPPVFPIRLKWNPPVPAPHQALALMWCCSSFGIVDPLASRTLRIALKDPETVVGKLDYSQRPSVAFARP
eukprot:gene18345-biopygen18960